MSAVAETYFRHGSVAGESHRYIWVSAEFHPGRGWTRPYMHKQITPSWARKLRAAGITHVELTYGPRGRDYRRLPAATQARLRRADFRTAELM